MPAAMGAISKAVARLIVARHILSAVAQRASFSLSRNPVTQARSSCTPQIGAAPALQARLCPALFHPRPVARRVSATIAGRAYHARQRPSPRCAARNAPAVGHCTPVPARRHRQMTRGICDLAVAQKKTRMSRGQCAGDCVNASSTIKLEGHARQIHRRASRRKRF